MKEISGDINCTKLLVTCCLLLKSVLGMSARTYATQAASLPHTGTTSFHFEISMNNKTIDNAYYNGRRLASVGGAQGRDFEKPQSSLGRFKGPDDGLQKASKSWVRRLQRLLTQPTTTCGRLVRVGGRSCVGAYDGSKVIFAKVNFLKNFCFFSIPIPVCGWYHGCVLFLLLQDHW